jgi:hypothetical protein
MTNPLKALKAVELNEEASLVNWYAEAGDVGEVVVEEDEPKITVRGNGKAHPARATKFGFMMSCSCPGSQNGRLEKACRKVADGWAASNCGN